MSEWMAEQLLEETDRVAIDKELRFLWLMWAGTLGTVPVLLFMSLTFARDLRDSAAVAPNVPLGVITAALSVLMVFSVFASFILRRLFLTGRFKFMQTQTAQTATSTNKPDYLAKYRVATFLPMTIAATPGFYGFILFVMGADLTFFYAFLVIAALAILYHRPRRDEIIHLLQSDKAQQSS
jgi:hypothetical protein